MQVGDMKRLRGKYFLSATDGKGSTDDCSHQVLENLG